MILSRVKALIVRPWQARRRRKRLEAIHGKEASDELVAALLVRTAEAVGLPVEECLQRLLADGSAEGVDGPTLSAYERRLRLAIAEYQP